MDRLRREQFFALAQVDIHSMRLIGAGKNAEITDPGKIRGFIQAVQGGRGVSAHHSYPTVIIQIAFNGVPETYSIGPDSVNLDEYWFSLESGPNLRLGERGRHISQFHSVEISNWLRNEIGMTLHFQK